MRDHGFGRFQTGESVSLVIGEGREAAGFAAVVASTGRDGIELVLKVAPIRATTLAPSRVVSVIGPDRVMHTAQILWTESTPELVVMLGQVDAGTPDGNQRQYRRVAMQLLPTHTSIISARSAARFRVHVVDLSGGGARLLSPRALLIDTSLSLTLPMSEGRDAINVRAQVMWVRRLYQSWLTGIHFEGVAPSERDLITRTVFLRRWKRANVGGS